MNTHVLPKSNPYKNYILTVNIIRFFSGIASGFGVCLGGIYMLYRKGEVRDGVELIPAVMLWCVLLIAVVIAVPVAVGLMARRIINRSNSEASRLCAQSAPLEWKPVTAEMTEYLRSKRKYPWVAVIAFVAVVLTLVITGAEAETYGIILAFTAMLCTALGFYICGDTFQCLLENTEFATAPVHHTFTDKGVKYAVVYLPEGERVFALKNKFLHREVKKLAFLSHLTNARLICDEEFLGLTDN